ncbi:MAG: hypothetical protein EXQ60_05865 [Candidatus Nanopelagicales bacterium]|nr:hypothetical protein [Candidatus Nanopelagicales bacterium]
MDVLTVSGDGSTRGFIQGQARAEQIVETWEVLRMHLTANGVDVAAVADRLLRSELVATAHQFTPDLWDEATGIAAGANIDIEQVMLLCFLDEVWSFTGGLGCSVAARSRDGFIGQTMDLPIWAAGRLMVLRVQSDLAPTALIMSYPGMIGLCGANSAGLGVAVNALEQFQADSNGLGVVFIMRHLLTLTSLAHAGEFLASVPHAAGQAYTVSAPDGIATWECGPGHVQRVTAPSVDQCAHTNHLLADPTNSTRSSIRRLTALQRALDNDLDLRQTLSHEVVLTDPRTSNSGVTFAAFIANPPADYVEFADGLTLRAGSPVWESIYYSPNASHQLGQQ